MISCGDWKIMRYKYLIINVFSCIFIILAGCQQQANMAEEPTTAAESKVAGPKIEFESMVYDFGKVGPREKLNGEFKFANTGDAPLKITEVEKCCGAVAQLDKDELAPGETGTLKVRYTSSVPNKMEKRLYVNTNDKDNSRLILTIQAETVLHVTYEPKIMKLHLKDENAGCPPIKIKSVDGKPFSVTNFMATSNSLTADFDPAVKATEYILQPKVDMEKLKRRSTGRINIGLTYSELNVQPETITVVFSTMSRFSHRPSNLVINIPSRKNQ